MLTLNEIRSEFLNFFARNNHEVVDSSPLVPRNDPTLLFTNSGMVQFKNLFTGVEKRSYKTAVTSQKCVRAGGKHNDLDNVGYTARHHTFFEMLGNFSFGDYFKDEAIPLAWDLLTKDLGLNREKLLVTVYHTDDEAAAIWRKYAGLSDDRIIRIATHDNFWSMGPTGPCGPCTEIFYDHGPDIPGGPPGSPDEDGDRFIEIWNLVFMQNERFDDGSMRELEMQSIDTGMGLERIGAVLQGKHDNYDTDLLRCLIEQSAHVTDGDPDGPGNVHHRVIADHLRSGAFLIADGVMPSNEGRGNVLRRIMRRAMRHAHLLDAKGLVMHKLVPKLVSQMGQAFPELGQAQALIAETLELEEKRFKLTLERGLRLLNEEVKKLGDGKVLPGETAFLLYDTYGFPLDLTQDALREMGRAVDVAGFDLAMAEQKAKARKAWSGIGSSREQEIWFDIADKNGPTEFLGYKEESAEGQIIALVSDGKCVGAAMEGENVHIVMNQTPFYAEAGGQVGDSGVIITQSGNALVKDTLKSADIFIHIAKVTQGRVETGDSAKLEVDCSRRVSIRSSHSATHLLHEALRKALGKHVSQRGSLNAEDRVRFDFSHSKALSADELDHVEKEVNEYIRQNSRVETRIMTPDDARVIGAQALFGEKYGDEVRVVSMGIQEGSGKGLDGRTYSLELCGGTHVRQTGDIGMFAVIGESASSAGVRRIEALTGEAALNYHASCGKQLSEIAQVLKTQPGEVVKRVRALLEERGNLAAEVMRLRRELAIGDGNTDHGLQIQKIGGVNFHSKIISDVSGKDLPPMIDQIKVRMGSGVVLLVAEKDSKAAAAVGVTGDLTKELSAVDLVRTAVRELGGKGGGGRPDMAQGGGPDASSAEAAVRAVERVLDKHTRTDAAIMKKEVKS